MSKIAIIIGAGPAGLTAAYELITKTDIKPIIIEKSNDIGGLSKTVVHNGNRIDIGGHRFFSKSDVVMKWWQNILPLQGSESKDDILKDIYYQNKKSSVIIPANGPDPEKEDQVMLIRNRLSRIFFLGKFFDYPITLNRKTISNLGFIRISKIAFTYLWAQLFRVKNIRSLEDFFISRFGTELYKTFFKDYTKKVWGRSCKEIGADWGTQRVKELSVSKAILHAIRSIFRKDKTIEQKNTDTSLIEQFMYPKLGPGQMWETVARLVEEKGAIIIKNSEVMELDIAGDRICEMSYFDNTTKLKNTIKGDYFFSTMPVKELITAMGNKVPQEVKEVALNLQYRDFITVGLLLNKLKIKNETKGPSLGNLVPDNWIYIQEKDVKIGRLQIFNNWSPYMVADMEKVWLGLEYFCNEGDELWQMSDADFMQFAINELHQINIIDRDEVIDRTIIRMLKTYPDYFGAYEQFDVVSDFTNQLENLFLIGRNGMHKYNNQDHSMLTAMAAVDNIIKGEKSKKNIWEINTEADFHETKKNG
ncbi:MAG: amine oxidase [Mucilaginibacter sp.]|uniref:NAD(P)/FAD-dependent oxidoreductase n=1 Tax=Mucilaginibacter sp. TaxID=1882438 RepID=UPI0026385256|nr:NAD(P)/FAD-dependent oxidoreductase [Mucilaginibacter sp.]MDB5003620.1 amine oxidase [Mucilaginibacter sp.]